MGRNRWTLATGSDVLVTLDMGSYHPLLGMYLFLFQSREQTNCWGAGRWFPFRPSDTDATRGSSLEVSEKPRRAIFDAVGVGGFGQLDLAEAEGQSVERSFSDLFPGPSVVPFYYSLGTKIEYRKRVPLF